MRWLTALIFVPILPLLAGCMFSEHAYIHGDLIVQPFKKKMTVRKEPANINGEIQEGFTMDIVARDDSDGYNVLSPKDGSVDYYVWFAEPKRNHYIAIAKESGNQKKWTYTFYVREGSTLYQHYPSYALSLVDKYAEESTENPFVNLDRETFAQLAIEHRRIAPDKLTATSYAQLQRVLDWVIRANRALPGEMRDLSLWTYTILHDE